MRAAAVGLVRAALVAVVGFCAAGCMDPGAASDMYMPPPGSARLILGGATALDGGFLPLVDGQDAPLIEGAQGGFHVWMKYRLENAPAGHYQVSRFAHRVRDDKIVLRIPAAAIDVSATPPDGGWDSPTAIPMFMCPSPIGISIVDESIRYEIDVTDDTGKPVAQGKIVMVPRCPRTPMESNVFCIRICTG